MEIEPLSDIPNYNLESFLIENEAEYQLKPQIGIIVTRWPCGVCKGDNEDENATFYSYRNTGMRLSCQRNPIGFVHLFFYLPNYLEFISVIAPCLDCRLYVRIVKLVIVYFRAVRTESPDSFVKGAIRHKSSVVF